MKEVLIGSTQILKCSVAVHKVDIAIKLRIEWTSRASILNESTIIFTGQNRTNYHLTLVLDSYKHDDTGTYECTAFILPTANTSALLETGNSSSSLSLVAHNGMFVFYTQAFLCILPVTYYFFIILCNCLHLHTYSFQDEHRSGLQSSI